MMCIMVYMTRTNIDLDDRLVAKAMQRYGLRTKKEAVDLALRRLVGPELSTEDVLALRGSGWDGDLDEIRGVVVIEEFD
jgi:Arc/MetJ family transcription regulator